MKDTWFHPDRIGTYKGEMKNGLADGKGIYTSSHKGKRSNYKYLYEGTFVKGLKVGKGIQIIHTSTYVIKFKGSFKNDMPHGHGVMTTIYKGKLEQKYIGEFKKGYREGRGKLIDYFQKTTKKGRFIKGSLKK